MTPETLARWQELMASRPAPVEMPDTPTLDNLAKLRLLLVGVRVTLRDLGVKDFGDLTMDEVDVLSRVG
jgi:hypothetical protein